MPDRNSKKYAIAIASMLAVLNALNAVLEKVQTDILDELAANW